MGFTRVDGVSVNLTATSGGLTMQSVLGESLSLDTPDLLVTHKLHMIDSTGDAPLRFATIKMFFEEHEYEQWCDFTYYHQQMMPEGERLTDDVSLDPFLLLESRLLNESRSVLMEQPPTWRCSKG